MNLEIHIPVRWRELDLQALGRRVIVMGGTDSGKSTFARYLFRRFQEAGLRAGFLDCDVGQSTVGLPTTLSLAAPASGLPTPAEGGSFPPAPGASYFVGSVSPRGYMLPILVGCQRLLEKAEALKVEALVVDTTGLVDPAQGGLALKQWKVELLRPTTVVAFRRERELEPLLWPLRLLPGVRVMEMPVLPEAHPRGRVERIARRERLLKSYFAGAGDLTFSWQQTPVYEVYRAAAGRLVALQDDKGYALALGTIRALSRQAATLTLRTPLSQPDQVHSLRVGASSFPQPQERREPGRPRRTHPGRRPTSE